MLNLLLMRCQINSSLVLEPTILTINSNSDNLFANNHRRMMSKQKQHDVIKKKHVLI